MNKDVRIYHKTKHSLNTLNGILNEKNLEYAKQSMLKEAIKEHTDLIKVKQHYPQNDISDVEMELDIVIIPTKQYAKILKLIESVKTEEENKVEEYLNFPKLKP